MIDVNFQFNLIASDWFQYLNQFPWKNIRSYSRIGKIRSLQWLLLSVTMTRLFFSSWINQRKQQIFFWSFTFYSFIGIDDSVLLFKHRISTEKINSEKSVNRFFINHQMKKYSRKVKQNILVAVELCKNNNLNWMKENEVIHACFAYKILWDLLGRWREVLNWFCEWKQKPLVTLLLQFFAVF